MMNRIGRSGRFGRKGVGINFVTDEDIKEPDAEEVVKHLISLGKGSLYKAMSKRVQ